MKSLQKKCLSLLLACAFAAGGATAVFGDTGGVALTMPGVAGTDMTLSLGSDKDALFTRGQLAAALTIMFGLTESATDGVRYADVQEGSPYFSPVYIMQREAVMGPLPDGFFRPDEPLQRWDFMAVLEHICAVCGEDPTVVAVSVFGEAYDPALKNQALTVSEMERYLNNLWEAMGLNIEPRTARETIFKLIYSVHRKDYAGSPTGLEEVWAEDKSYVCLIPTPSPMDGGNIYAAYFGTDPDYAKNGGDVSTVNMFVVSQDGAYYYTVVDLFGTVNTQKVTVTGVKI